MHSKSSKVPRSRFRKWARRLVLALLLLILIPLALFTVGYFNRNRILTALQQQYAQNSTGNLTIGEINTSFISGFPNIGFTLKDIEQTSSDSITDKISELKIEEAQLVIGARKLLSGNFSFKKITITNGVYATKILPRYSKSYYESLKSDKHEDAGSEIIYPSWLDKSGATLVLKNFQFIEKDAVFKKSFDIHMDYFKSSFRRKDNLITGETDLTLDIKALDFNTDKGSFLKNAKLTGNFNFHINLKHGKIEIPQFPLAIDQQIFLVTAHFQKGAATTYNFELENNKTDFAKIKTLVSNHLSEKINKYDIQKPFYSKIKISGLFSHGHNPDITAEFHSLDNSLSISDRFQFKNATFKGYLTNNIYTSDSLKASKKTSKDFKLAFETITASLSDVAVKIENSFYQSTPEARNYFDAYVNLRGPNEALATLIKTENFDFTGGKFQLDAHIDGDIPNPYQFLNKATGKFILNDTQVQLKKNGLQLPIETIAIDLKRENADLENLIVTLSSGDQLTFKGHFKNISGILAPKPLIPTTSDITLIAPNLNINDVLSTAKQLIPPSSQKVNDRKDLHETLEIIYNLFQPKFDIKIDTLTYKAVSITDVKSQLQLLTSETLSLHNFSFNYEDARTNLTGKLNVYGPETGLKNAIYIDAKATSDGPIKVFKSLFNITLFEMRSGNFLFNGNVKGNVAALDELLGEAQGNLRFDNLDLYYPPTAMDVVIDSLSLEVDKSDIILNKFDLEIEELSPITFSGRIHKFPNLLLDRIEEPGAISLNISAPRIEADTIIKTLEAFKRKNPLKKAAEKKPLHAVFEDFNRFNPEIQIAIDTLLYKNLITEKVRAQFSFDNDSLLKLNNFEIAYNQTLVKITGEINAHTSRRDLVSNNPFDLNFDISVKGQSQDLNAYLKTKNFIFQSGNFEFEGNYQAQATDLKLINPENYGDLKIDSTLVDFKAANLIIPVDSLHVIFNNDLANLKTLHIDLPGKSSVYFSGAIDHFSKFIDNVKGENQHQSNFHIFSPYLDVADVEEFFKNSTLGDSTKSAFDFQKTKASLKSIYNSFYPTITLKIDSLKQQNLEIQNFRSTFLFDDYGNFSIDSTNFNFHKSSIDFNISADLNSKTLTPTAVDMHVSDLNISQILTDFNYFNNENLKKADSIKGIINIKLNGNAVVDALGKIQLSTLNGTLNFSLDSLALYNFQPIMDVIPLLKKERFKNLRFQPIVQTFEIINGEIIIPQTEIQSSAIHIFVEGKVKLEDYINIWFSIPWKNLKKNDGLKLPENTDYKDAGSKFYIQLLQNSSSKKDKNEKLKVKFKLSNRKLRKLRHAD